MAVQEILAGLPWWVKWIAIPALVLLVFGGVITSVLTFVVGLLFKILLFVALVAGLIYVVRKFGSSARSGRDW
ncbi:DUF5326 family protein [Streptomyces griseus]|uniref:DUF5326 family protein n=1 Tax=Streptomyces griseus TaxID=1911 RepID=UPI0004C7A07E|nr:DUF5326 family protein [Streptomyces griseus]